MNRSRLFLITALVVLAVLAAWLWWVRPQSVDMAAYAPAEALLYLETNNPTDVAAALANTDAWKLVGDLTGNASRTDNKWSRKFVRWTGLGPAKSVIVTRAQLAVVVTDLGVSQDDDSLTVKPEAVLLVETHTSASRIKSPLEDALKQFAENAYGQPTLRRTNLDGFELIEWTAPGGTRQVVATITGTLIIVGNAERAVQKVLAVQSARLPSLRDDPDLKRLRLNLQADKALAFGYVPPKSSGRLLSVAVPMLLGRAPGSSEFERLVDSASSKIVSSLGWSARGFMDGIEDRYSIELQPSMVTKLKESFSCREGSSSLNTMVPGNFASVTNYGFQNPALAWQGLRSSVTYQVDALSAVFFSSLMKSALLPYGISDPDKFLSEIEGPVITSRVDNESPSSVLIARIRNEGAMRDLLTKGMGFRRIASKETDELFSDIEGEFAARIDNGSVVIGPSAEVSRYVEKALSASRDQLSASPRVRSTSSSDGACVLTYANDTERVRTFVTSIITASGGRPLWSDKTEQELRALPYSTTETSLGEHGIVRVTRSSLGQFSSLLPLILPEQKASNESPGR
ncbi:MAG TPA: hypothetical protein VHR36_07955 [Pyrinomonadaceae bacterium]|nr:hypothetical protein [Pyrinomonadaceae bacterium]